MDLFSGIGGFALGAYWAGMRFDKHYFSEVDDWATKLYQKRFPDAIPLGDIRGIDGKALADTDAGDSRRRADESGRRQERGTSVGGSRTDWILTGGFPCQDISFAGKGAGLEGERSGLWWEYHRLISELRPRFAIVENVAALTVRGIDVVLGSLAQIGFDAEWDCIRASDVGAPHRRERIWIVAYPATLGCGQGRERRPVAVGAGESEQSLQVAHPKEQPEWSGLRESEPGRQWGRRLGNGGGEGDVTDTGSKRGTAGIPTATARQEGFAGESINGGYQQRRRQGTNDRPTQSRLGGFAHDVSQWLDGSWERGVPRLATGVPKRVDRLRGLGNAIVPQIAELIFRQIKELIWQH